MSELRLGMAGAGTGLAKVRVRGQPGFVLQQRLALRAPPVKTDVRLLPAFDTYLLGYRRRDLAVSPPLQGRLQRGGGWLHPAVVVNGRAVAAWRMSRTAIGGRINVGHLEGLPRASRAVGNEVVADITR